MSAPAGPDPSVTPHTPSVASEQGDLEVVYALGTPGHQTVKIGTTRNLAKRIADIQRMSPVPLEVLWTHPGGHELETNLHRHFKTIRSHGEWFHFQSDPVTRIRWAVEDPPWLRPKVNLKKKRKPTPPPPRPSIPAPPPTDERRAFDELMEFTATLPERLRSIPDPADRYAALVEAEERKDLLVKASLREVAVNLKSHGLTWREVGNVMGGVSSQRAHQISKFPRLPD